MNGTYANTKSQKCGFHNRCYFVTSVKTNGFTDVQGKTLFNEGYDLGLEQFNRTYVKEKSQKIKNDFLNLENPSVKYT